MLAHCIQQLQLWPPSQASLCSSALTIARQHLHRQKVLHKDPYRFVNHLSVLNLGSPAQGIIVVTLQYRQVLGQSTQAPESSLGRPVLVVDLLSFSDS